VLTGAPARPRLAHRRARRPVRPVGVRHPAPRRRRGRDPRV